METEKQTPNDMAGRYVKVRDARRKMKADWETRDKVLADELDRLEGLMLGFLNETEQDSSKTANGTIYVEDVILPTGSDWELFYNWIRENNAFEALERRIKRNFIKDYMDQNDGGIPPGVSVLSSRVVRVRRGKGEE